MPSPTAVPPTACIGTAKYRCNSRSSQEGAIEPKKRCFHVARGAQALVGLSQLMDRTSTPSMPHLHGVLGDTYLRVDGIWFCLSGKPISLCSEAPVSEFQVAGSCGKNLRDTPRTWAWKCHKMPVIWEVLFIYGGTGLRWGAEVFHSVMLKGYYI